MDESAVPCGVFFGAADYLNRLSQLAESAAIARVFCDGFRLRCPCTLRDSMPSLSGEHSLAQ
jgi:hypothetical protein